MLQRLKRVHSIIPCLMMSWHCLGLVLCSIWMIWYVFSANCCAELAEVLYRRVVIIYGLTMEEFAHQRLLEIMSRSTEFRVNFVFKENVYGDGDIQHREDALWEGWRFILHCYTVKKDFTTWCKGLKAEIFWTRVKHFKVKLLVVFPISRFSW